MSLNRTEQALFDYWSRQPDEMSYWKMKVSETLKTQGAGTPAARLERELRSYLVERSEHVFALRSLAGPDAAKIRLINLAEYLMRLWGPLPKSRAKLAADRS